MSIEVGLNLEYIRCEDNPLTRPFAVPPNSATATLNRSSTTAANC
jgi:hypothetical protein